MNKLFFTLTVLLTFSAASNVGADILYLKNGTQVEGKAVHQSQEKVIFRIGNDKDNVDVTFFSDEILRLDKTDLPTYIELPFLQKQGQGVRVPRPIVGTTPLSRERSAETPEPQTMPVMQPPMQQPLTLGDSQNVTESSQAAPKQPVSLKDILDQKNSALFRQQQLIQEIKPRLNEDELNYITRIETVAKPLVAKAQQFLLGPSVAQQDPSQSQGSLQELSIQMKTVLGEVSIMQPPLLFGAFHKKYIEIVSMLNAGLGDMIKGEITQQQLVWAKVYRAEEDLIAELERIIEEKKQVAL